ncbi:STN and carboxypeptidase regulatory-like domain-containing protein [Sphingobacterium tabacisoli]|uniref:STN and carboxypeptidase regulatory-like domain-containing protein n=1 Tax=Sphingobacterium tabacisoli TaxID=2044855 RepID=A0ABW5L3F6_9SPHI|nr:STN and carboxypeptidase regulatory-like domain-containing protein [Sphingobacterium tabacisoli]
MNFKFHIKQDFGWPCAMRISWFDQPVLFKILMTMKLTVLLLTIFTLTVQASVHAQRVDIHVQNERLDKVFDALYKQSGYAFVFNAKQLQSAKRVTVHLKDIPVEQAVKTILSDQPFDYAIDEKVITIKAKKVGPPKSKIEINQYEDPDTKEWVIEGRVIDAETKQPIEGVTIRVRRDGISTESDKNGDFRIVISKNGDSEFYK